MITEFLTLLSAQKQCQNVNDNCQNRHTLSNDLALYSSKNAPQFHAACPRDALVNQSPEDSSPDAVKLSVHLTCAAEKGTLLYFRYSEECPGQPTYRFTTAPRR